jgi:hypothetical protein
MASAVFSTAVRAAFSDLPCLRRISIFDMGSGFSRVRARAALLL